MAFEGTQFNSQPLVTEKILKMETVKISFQRNSGAVSKLRGRQLSTKPTTVKTRELYQVSAMTGLVLGHK